MDRLGALCPPLVVACEPCKRRGSYRTCRLIERFGADASLDDVRRALTRSCRWQRAAGLREGNQYVPRCMARILPPASSAPRHDTTLTGREITPYRVDEWLPDGVGIAQELALVSRAHLATLTFEAAVQLDPEGRITLSKGAQRMRATFEVHQDLHPGRWPGAD